MSARLYTIGGAAGLALLLAGCGGSVGSLVATKNKFIACPPEIKPIELACPEWPTGTVTLRDWAKVREQRKLIWQTCRQSYQDVFDEHDDCLDAVEELN